MKRGDVGLSSLLKLYGLGTLLGVALIGRAPGISGTIVVVVAGVVTWLATARWLRLLAPAVAGFWALIAIGASAKRAEEARALPPNPPGAAVPGPVAKPAAASDPVAKRYDLLDMLPARIGKLELVTAVRGADFVPREQRSVTGRYRWTDPMLKDAAFLGPPIAELSCLGGAVNKADRDCHDKGSSKVSVGGRGGCIYPEEQPSKKTAGLKLYGLAIGWHAWGDCMLQFELGAMASHPTQDAVDAADAAARWIDRFLPGGLPPPQPSLEANRRVLDRAAATAKAAP